MAKNQFKLERLYVDCNSIVGRLSFNSKQICYTLEHLGKEIPCGEYPLKKTYSPKFKRSLPIVCNVPGRSGIRIHSGNTYVDSSGCILVGWNVSRTLTREVFLCNSLDALKYVNCFDFNDTSICVTSSVK